MNNGYIKWIRCIEFAKSSTSWFDLRRHVHALFFLCICLHPKILLLEVLCTVIENIHNEVPCFALSADLWYIYCAHSLPRQTIKFKISHKFGFYCQHQIYNRHQLFKWLVNQRTISALFTRSDHFHLRARSRSLVFSLFFTLIFIHVVYFFFNFFHA